jgi:hypothetical protein
MSAAELLAALADLHVGVEADGERLRVDAPAGVLTPEHRRALAEHKPTLLALLRGAPTSKAEAEDVEILVSDKDWPRWTATRQAKTVLQICDRARVLRALGKDVSVGESDFLLALCEALRARSEGFVPLTVCTGVTLADTCMFLVLTLNELLQGFTLEVNEARLAAFARAIDMSEMPGPSHGGAETAA